MKWVPARFHDVVVTSDGPNRTGRHVTSDGPESLSYLTEISFQKVLLGTKPISFKETLC